MDSSTASDQMANISPVIIIVIVMLLTLFRVSIARYRHPWARTLSEICDTFNVVMILAFLLIRPFVAQAFYIPSESMTNTLQVHDRLIVDKFSYRLHPPQRHDVVVFNGPANATPEHRDDIAFIKRLIGEPGDTIQVKAATLTIGGDVITLNPDGSGVDAHRYVRDALQLTSGDSVKFFADHIQIDDSRNVPPEEFAVLIGQPGTKIAITPGQTIVNGRVQDEPYIREDPGYSYPPAGALVVPPDHLFMMGDNRNDSEDSHAWGPLDANRVIGHADLIFWPLPRIGWIR